MIDGRDHQGQEVESLLLLRRRHRKEVLDFGHTLAGKVGHDACIQLQHLVDVDVHLYTSRCPIKIRTSKLINIIVLLHITHF